MKRYLIVLLVIGAALALGASPGLYRSQSTGIVDAQQEPLGYEQITSLSSATTLTVPDGAVRAVIQAEADDLRWQDDGDSPTASTGMIIYAGDNPFVYVGDLDTIELIEINGSGKANVSYYGN
jgi:hypothetical protein